MADSVNVFAALIRNVVAYAYLIGQVLAGNLDAPQFILYFSAVSGFTNWVQGIMENVGQIRQSGVGISDVMELLFMRNHTGSRVENIFHRIQKDNMSFAWKMSASGIRVHQRIRYTN